MPTDIWREENKDKMRAYRRKWYAKNKPKTYGKVKSRKLALKTWLDEYKLSLKCNRCGENHPGVIQFHHSDPSEKEIDISRVVTNGWSIERIKKEIDKCEVLCANCHFKHHYEERALV